MSHETTLWNKKSWVHRWFLIQFYDQCKINELKALMGVWMV
jgi:hypothetical protein